MRSNGKREKWVEKFYLKYSTATSRVKRKLQKVIIIREYNTQKGGDQKQQKRAGIPSKKEGNPVEVGEGDPTKILENLNHSRGLQATHELGGLNVEV